MKPNLSLRIGHFEWQAVSTAGVRPGMKSPRGEIAAFSRVDLICVLLVVSILAAALFPALARVHVTTQTDQCLYNLRQLTAAWWMYASDNEGNLAPNRGLFPANPDYNAYPKWVAGDMRGGSVGGPYTGIDATNTALLVNPNYSQLAAYIKNPAVYHCPTDQSTWGMAGYMERQRVRSYSMSGAIGCAANGGLVGADVQGHWLSTQNANQPGGSPWRVYIKASDLVAPAPSRLWVMLDEHPNSINDSTFAVLMPTAPNHTIWIDIPAKYHQNGCDFSFADGHVEFHQWQDPQAIPPVTWAADTLPGLGNQINSAAADPDLLWLVHRTSAVATGISVPYEP